MDEKAWEAAAAFGESLRISEESKMEGERARTLTAWSQHAQAQGDSERAAALRQEAREIFVRIGAALEAERLEA